MQLFEFVVKEFNQCFILDLDTLFEQPTESAWPNLTSEPRFSGSKLRMACTACNNDECSGHAEQRNDEVSTSPLVRYSVHVWAFDDPQPHQRFQNLDFLSLNCQTSVSGFVQETHSLVDEFLNLFRVRS